MGAVLSSYAAAVDAARARATKKYAQQRGLISSSDVAAAADDYWSGLPDDLLLTIMAALDIPNLRRAGAVCSSWRDAHNAFRLPELEQAPCLLYACEEYGSNDAALYCPSTKATFRVPFPGPPHEKRGFAFSCNGGWVFTTDEVGDPYLLNPVTGVQAMLPPVNTIHHYDDDDESFYDDDGKHVWDAEPENEWERPHLSWARHTKYHRVAVSAAAKVTECTVLIVHAPYRSLSYARPGDERWKLLPVSDDTSSVENILYNDKDGLFYILCTSGSVSTIDLSGPSPLVTMIMHDVTSYCRLQTMYLVLGPSGELLQVWRIWDHPNNPLKYRSTYQGILNRIHQDCIDLASGDDNGDELSGLETNHDEEDEFYEPDDTDDQEIDVSELLREGIDMPHRLVDKVTTYELLVFKVDTDRQKLVELRDLGDHALFLGLNSVMCLSTKDFPVFEPNCAYLTDDCSLYRPMLRKDLGIWNIKNRSMQKLGDALPNLYPWLHLPAPIWITAKF
ncbi:hypothetical protein VPH35_068163 [Triticum aestivum]